MMSSAPINDTASSFVLEDHTCQRFTLAEIKSATNNFHEDKVIGHGGFGKVYKCSEIGSRGEVAVKKLHYMSNQGLKEFVAEVKVVSDLRHGNLVSLIGYCNEENVFALVYEFMPNGTLEDMKTSLPWLDLLKVCIGAARGLDYLHTGTSTQHGVIHRDVKTANILLDANFAGKIADFGLAKVDIIDQTPTHVSSGLIGTIGYMDPSYLCTGNFTTKSDVYAFGVVLFEVLSGRKALDISLDEEQRSLALWAQQQIKEGKLNQIMDPRLLGQISEKCLEEFASIAGNCLHTQPKQRPTMAEVVFKLESILSQETESANSVVDEGFVFTGNVDDATGSQSDFSVDHIPTIIKDDIQRIFTYAELKQATNGFRKKIHSPALDESIYKGWVDERTYAPTERGVGLAMYVRKMEILTWEPEMNLKDFNHPNLVKLLGCCFHNHKLFCVYENISGITLDKYLYGGRSSLSWVSRLKIAMGAAEGLLYLHLRKQPGYSQFQTNLILVDKEFNARLSYFAFDSYTFRLKAHYAAPEWFRLQADSFDRSVEWKPPADENHDVYAFGVVLLEILTGMKVHDDKRPLGKKNLVTWATPLLADEVNLRMIMDPKLVRKNCPPKGAFELAQLVSNCLQPNKDKRPSMKKILEVLDHCYQDKIKAV